jgi:hypothetical protein
MINLYTLQQLADRATFFPFQCLVHYGPCGRFGQLKALIRGT